MALSGDGGDESFAGYDFRYVPHAIEAPLRAGRCREPLAPAVRRGSARAWPRVAASARPLRVGTLLENLGRDPGRRLLRRPAFLKPGDDATPDGAAGRPRSDRAARSTRRSPSRTGVARPRRGAARRIRRPEGVPAERSAGEGGPHEHGAQPRGALSAARSPGGGAGIPDPAGDESRRAAGARRCSAARARAPPGPVGSCRSAASPRRSASGLPGRIAAMFRDEVLRPQAAIAAHVDQREVERRFRAHQRGQADHGYALWALWVLERWFQQMAKRDQAAGSLAPVAGGY